MPLSNDFQAEIDAPLSILWGLRLGLILFLLASAVGGLMSAWLRHSIGVADGGAGLPFVNWSTRGGDLRAAHFVGMHALQALPLFALALERYAKQYATPATIAFSLAYLGLFAFILAQALAGQPLLAMFH